jgi:hypothetical protein
MSSEFINLNVNINSQYVLRPNSHCIAITISDTARQSEAEMSAIKPKDA